MPTFTRKLSELLQEGFDLGLTQEDYPIYDETAREALNTKITRHYWNYEIGQETESMFRFALNRKMNEIMPYYNQLYKSTQLEFDPLLTMKYSDIVSGTEHATGASNTSSSADNTANSDTNSRARTVSSDTPQVLLSPNEDYASGANNSVSDATVNSTNNATSTEANNRSDDRTNSATRNLEGYNGVPATDLLMKLRGSFLNIDMMVIRELETLFMQVWDNGDEYFGVESWMNNVTTFGWTVL